MPTAIAFGVLGYWLGGNNGALYAACIPVAVFYFRLWINAPEKEKGRIGALLTLTVLLIPFWMVFNLNNTVLSDWAKDNTDREVPASTTSTLKEVNLLEEAAVDYFYNADPAKQLEEVGYKKAGPIPVTLEEFGKIYANSNGQTLSLGEALPVANPELFQSINPGFIILLSPLFVLAWKVLRKRKQEPTTLRKMTMGMVFAAGCWLVMLLAVYNTNDGTAKGPAHWLIHAYFWITMGELCLSPIGLSLVSKMTPKHLGALMMGGFFLSSAIGNKLSGTIGGPVWKLLRAAISSSGWPH